MNNKIQLLKEWKSLVRQIDLYDKSYDEGLPLINDNLYDELRNRLAYIESIIGIQKDSPLHKIRGEAHGNKIRHSELMLSLDHGFGIKSINGFINKIQNTGHNPFPIIAEHKIDGISLAIRYSNGNIQILTRGNGIEGIDVTEQMQYLDIPRNINENIEIRGELYMKHHDFAKIADKFSSPRNYCASLIQNKYSIPNAKVSFAPHNAMICDKHNIISYIDKINYIKELGFKPIISWICNNQDDCAEVFKGVESNLKNIEYPIDGVVYKVNCLEIWNVLGSHNTAPRYAFAAKFHKIIYETTIRDISFQIGKFGTITPVAIFDCIEIDGNKITRATIHNVDELKKNSYGVGDKIGISRAGDSIPYINSKLFNADNFKIIDRCPCCGFALEQFEKTLRCNNSWNCIEQKIDRIYHFCSIEGFNIKGVGLNIIKEMVQSGFISKPIDIFNLPSKILNKELYLSKGWNVKSINNLLLSIEKSKNVRFANMIYALCIPNVGYGVSKGLAKYYPNFDAFITNFKYIPDKIPGIGVKIIESIKTFLHAEDNKWIFALQDKIIINYN